METSSKRLSLPYKKIIFFFIIIFTILPIFILPVYSKFYHKLYQLPVIKNGILEGSKLDLKKYKQIPLDGEWEFYGNSILTTNSELQSKAPSIIKIPKSLEKHNNKTIASYRIQIKGNKLPANLIVYIPNIVSNYRTFINGTLCISKVYENIYEPSNNNLFIFNNYTESVFVEKGQDIEIIIQLESSYIHGLYTTPYLTTMDSYNKSQEYRTFLSNCYFGILVIFILFLIFIIIRYKYNGIIPTIALIIMDVCILLKILTKNELYGLSDIIFPKFENYFASAFCQLISFYLPIVFLYCAKKIFRFAIEKKVILHIFIYEFFIGFIVLFFTLYASPFFMLIFTIIGYFPFCYIVYQLYHQLNKDDNNILIVTAILLFAVTSMIGSCLSSSGLIIVDFSLFSPTCFVISVLLQLILYTEQNNKIYIEALEAENLKLQLKDTQLSLMLSQIQPHFIYNTLLTIHVLCIEEPETAADIVLKFSNYLRNNMRFAKEENFITFEQELNHIKNYVDIEKQRFGSKLTVDYNIGISNFMIPPLSIQPLIENGIRYGACKRVDGQGKVYLKTCYKDDFLHIIIFDNGPGFTKGKIKNDSFGIFNVSMRLKELMNARVEFESSDQYTIVTITIPQKNIINTNDTF